MDSATTGNQGLDEQNKGPASIVIIHQGSSSSSTSENHCHDSRLISRPRTSFRNPNSFPFPRSGTFLNGRFQEQPPHFLDACFLCKKPLGCNRDIFMYRGDVPFCSVECRDEQIEIDDAIEKNRNLSASIKAMRKKEEREKSPGSSPNYPFHSGAVVAA